jgi:hypothetical protein
MNASVDPHGSVHTVLVASEEVLAAWCARHPAPGDVVALDEADTTHALEVIVRRRPEVVVIEQRYLSTARGQAFVHRLRHDEDLPPVEIRVLSPEHTAAIASAHSPIAISPSAIVALAQPISGPVRRAVRVQMPEGVQVRIDGAPAELVDLSVFGAQIVSPKTLKPNQKVRLQMSDDSGTLRAVAGVAWSTFEIPKGRSPRYRVGMEFRNADPDTIEAFYSRLVTSAPLKK